MKGQVLTDALKALGKGELTAEKAIELANASNSLVARFSDDKVVFASLNSGWSHELIRGQDGAWQHPAGRQVLERRKGVLARAMGLTDHCIPAKAIQAPAELAPAPAPAPKGKGKGKGKA